MRLNKFWSEQDGQTLVLAAVSMIMVVGMLALSVDAGMLRYKKRQLQTLADASALAGALAIPSCAGTTNCSVMRTAATGALTENGFSSTLLTNCAARSGTTLELTLNNPPCAIATDPNAGSANYVEAVVSAPVATVFAQLLGISKVNLSARSEASSKSSTQCVYFLSAYSSQSSFSMTNQSISATCGFYLGQSYTFSGGSSSGAQFTVAGSSSSSTGSVSPVPTFNASALTDPLSRLTAPSYSGCTRTNYTVNTNATLQPGTYCGGLTIAPPPGVNGITVTLNAGMYIILGPLTISKASLTGSGVTFYVSQGNGYAYGASKISDLAATLSAPTSGSYQGVLFYSDRSLPSGHASLTLQNWNPGTKLDGILYLPGQALLASNVTLQGNNYFGVVADYSTMNNTAFTPSANYSSLASGSPFTTSSGAFLVQ